MSCYLLSVHGVGGEGREPVTDEELAQSHQQLGVLEQELKSAGAWVVSGRLHQAATATVVRLADGGVVTTDGPLWSPRNTRAASTSSRPRTSMPRSVGCRGSPGHQGAD